MMENHQSDCAFDRQGDLADRYVNRALGLEEAHAFEAHYFACETCWREVRRAVEVSAAFEKAEKSRIPAATIPIQRGGRATPFATGWRTLAAAAVAAFILVGVWRILAERESRPPDDAVRAPEATLPVSAYTSGSALIALWPSVEEAQVYHVRLFAEDGGLLLERDIVDTTLVVEAATLPPAEPGSSLYWEIEALDPLNQVLARSGLRKVKRPPD